MNNFDELLKKANENDLYATCEIGIYFNTKGHIDESIEWHKKAADKGYDNSIYLLGCMYRYDKKDFQEAIKWFTIIAEKGYKHAQYKLGELYLEELNNKEEAKKWLKKAAEQKHESAIKILEKLEKKEHIN